MMRSYVLLSSFFLLFRKFKRDFSFFNGFRGYFGWDFLMIVILPFFIFLIYSRVVLQELSEIIFFIQFFILRFLINIEADIYCFYLLLHKRRNVLLVSFLLITKGTKLKELISLLTCLNFLQNIYNYILFPLILLYFIQGLLSLVSVRDFLGLNHLLKKTIVFCFLLNI